MTAKQVQAGDTSTHSAEGFLITAIDHGRTAVLLGPYSTKEDAEHDVPAGRRLAHQVSAWAQFWAYGVTRVVMPPGKPLPRGKLNHLAAAAASAQEGSL